MAQFPKLSGFLNPWKKTLFFFELNVPSSGAEQMPAWKEALTLKVEQADIKAEDEAALKKEIAEFRASSSESKEHFDARIRYQTYRKEVLKRSGDRYGDLTNEVMTKNDPMVYLENKESNALSKDVAANELVQGAELTVNYGVGVEGVNQTKARQAQRRIGLHHMLASAPQVTKVEATNLSGATVVLIRCPDGKYRAEGHLKEKRHYAVYQGFKIKVLEIGGKAEAEKMASQEAEVKREEAALEVAQTELQKVQSAEAQTVETQTAEQVAAERRSALEMAGIVSGAPAPVPVETPLDAEQEKAFNAQRDILMGGVQQLTEELFGDRKTEQLVSGCAEELKNKKFKSISYKPETAQGEMQEVTLTLVDKKGVEHTYKGVSNHPIEVNAFIKKDLPRITPEAQQVKAFAWNVEATKDLIKKLAEKSGGEIPHPGMDSPYANGVIYGGVRAAGTNGEEGSSETYVPSSGETGNSRLSPNGDTNSERGYEADRIQSLKAGEGARLPDAMKDWTIRDFEANKHSVDHMDQFWNALKVLAKKSGRGEMELLKPFLDGDKITYQELCRQVYGRTPKRVEEDYTEARDGVAEQSDYTAKHPGEAAPSDEAFSKVKKTDKVGEKQDVYYKYGELKAFVKDREDFFVASYRLLEATRVLEKNKAAVRSDAAAELGSDSADVANAKGIIAGIFDPNDKAPLAKRTLWEALRGEEIEASMDQTGRSYLMNGENVYESSISSSGAYAMLLGEFTKGEKVNYEGLASRLTQMRSAGHLYYEIMGEKAKAQLNSKLAEKWGCSVEEVKRRIKKANDATEVEPGKLKNNPGEALTQADILLIQLGMIPQETLVESSQESVMERQMLKRVEAQAEKQVAAAVRDLELAQKKYTNKPFTAEEIKQYEAEVLKKMCIRMNENGQFGLVFADLNGDFNSDVGVGYGKELLSIPVGEKGKVSINAGIGVGFVSHMTILDATNVGVNVVATRTFGEQDQNTASATVGVSAGIGHAEVGVMGTIKLKGKADEKTGQPKVWYFKAGVGAVAGVGLENGIASITVARIEIGRDLDAAARLKYQKLKERMGPAFDQELNAYVEKSVTVNQTKIDADTAGMSQVEKDQYLHMFRASIAQLYIKERGEQAIDTMFPIQFGHIGVGLGVGGTGALTAFAVPYFGITLKGRKIVRYMKPAGAQNMDAIAEAKFREQLAAETKDERLGQVVYMSGNLNMNESGERSQEGALISIEQAKSLAGLNERLKAQGMELVANPADQSKLKLKVHSVDGFVNLYVDPSSNIEVVRGPDNYPYINLDFTDALNMLRVDNYTAFTEGGGGVKNVDIYITNNPEKGISSIKDRSGDRITWRQTDIYPDGSPKNTLLDAMHVERTTYMDPKLSATFGSEAAMANAGVEVGDLNNETAISERARVQAEMLAILGENEVVEGTPRIDQLNKDIKTLIDKHGVDYIKLTGNAEYSKGLLDAEKARMGGKMSADERTYFLQNLLVQSRAKTPGSPEAMSRHILGWNTRALEAFCSSHGMDAATGKAIMDAYDKKMGAALGGDLPSTQMEKGYAFHTLIGQGEIGTLGRGINSGAASGLAGMETVTVENLTSTFGMSSSQAELFIQAELREYRYMSNTPSPRDKMNSPMGIDLLNQASGMFELETAKFLLEARKTGTVDTTSPHWIAYETALTSLETTGVFVSPSGHVLVRDQHIVMGFLESCRNFTVAARERVTTRNTDSVHTVDTFEGRDGNKGNNLTTVDVAVAATPEKPVIPPRHRPHRKGPSEQGEVDVIDDTKDDGDNTNNSSNTLN